MCKTLKAQLFTVLILTAFLTIFPSGLARAAESGEKAKIESLILHIEGLKGAKFIRNGSSYDAVSAGKFLRGKWQSKEKEIQSADDFISKVASVSSTTGKPYSIKFSDGHEEMCGKYLKSILTKSP